MGELREDDLRVDIWRNGAAGTAARHAVRVTHLPTGIVATADGTSAQTETRERALGDLRARIDALDAYQAASNEIRDLTGD